MILPGHWSLAAKESLDALIDDERFGAQAERQSHCLLAGSYTGEYEADVEHVPDDAEIADLRRGVKNPVSDGIAANAIEGVVE